MDNERVLKKIEELMKIHRISRYRLAQLSGIKKSTITTIFNKRSTVSLRNLSKICKAFDLTLSEFFAMLEESPGVSADSDFPMEWWNDLPQDKRRKVSTIMFTLAALDEDEKQENVK